MRDEEIQTEASQARQYDDLAGLEPVEALTAVEHHLQRADTECERDEPEPVETSARIALRLGQERETADQRDQPERDVDVVDPAPRSVLGQIPANGRPDYRPAHGAG